MDDYRSKPPWIKLWASKYADFLDIDAVLDEYKGKELNDFVRGMGMVFLNLLYAYSHYDEGEFAIFELDDRYHKMLYKQLMRDLRQTFSDYERRCEANRENGKKGGRPSCDSDNE